MAALKMVNIELSKLIPYVKNAKRHPQYQIDSLEKAIKEFDFDQPIVVDKNMVIIKGHGRYLAAKQGGIKKIPVIIRTDLTKDQVLASRLSDNKLAETSWDNELLLQELQELNSLEMLDGAINCTGFTIQDLEELEKYQDFEVEEQETEIDVSALNTDGVIKLVFKYEEYTKIIEKLATKKNSAESIFKKALGL